MRRPSRARLGIGDTVRVTWQDIEAKSGWVEKSSFEQWAEAPFSDRISYGVVAYNLLGALVIVSSQSPADTDAHVGDATKIPWANVLKIDVIEEAE